MTRLLLGAAACALIVVALFTSLARADDAAPPDDPVAKNAGVHVDPDGARYVGSANPQQRECMSWATFAGRVMALKHKGIPASHVLSVMFGVADVPEIAHNRIVAIVAEGYVWPRGDEDYQTWTFGQCMKGWPRTPESSSDAGPVFRRVASSQKLYCENRLPFAELVARDFAAGLTIDQLGAISEADQRTIKDVAWCLKAREELRACVQRRCIGVGASNDAGRERFRQAVRESLRRNTALFRSAHP